MRASKPAWQQQIAKERVEILFSEAEKAFRAGRTDLANRYVEIARAIGMKVNLPIPSEYRGRFCRKCDSYLVEGKNATARKLPKENLIEIACGRCGNKIRIGYVDDNERATGQPFQAPRVETKKAVSRQFL